MILSIELSDEAWQKLQVSREFSDLTEQEFIEQFLLFLPEPGGDTFGNIVALAHVMAHAIAQQKYNGFMAALEAMWGTSDRISELTDELEEEFAEG